MLRMLFNPWQIILIALAGWMNREQSVVIEYMKEENRVLRELLGKKRLRLNNDQRRRLAAKGKTLGRKLLSTCCSIVTPDTILRWHRKLIAVKYDGSSKLDLAGHGSAIASGTSQFSWLARTASGVLVQRFWSPVLAPERCQRVQ